MRHRTALKTIVAAGVLSLLVCASQGQAQRAAGASANRRPGCLDCTPATDIVGALAREEFLDSIRAFMTRADQRERSEWKRRDVTLISYPGLRVAQEPAPDGPEFQWAEVANPELAFFRGVRVGTPVTEVLRLWGPPEDDERRGRGRRLAWYVWETDGVTLYTTRGIVTLIVVNKYFGGFEPQQL